MRIAYGVHGYGRGHATRALAVLADLVRRHDVLILAGGDAYDAMHREHPVVRIPTLGYYYRKNGTRSNWQTLKRNGPAVLDLFFHGPASQMVEDALRDFRADVAISDAEPWTSHTARRLGIPRIGFDHFGIMAHCRPEMSWCDRVVSSRDAWVYRRLMGQPERVIVSSFYDAPPLRPGVTVIGTLLRREVFGVKPSRGEYLLGYFNKGMHLFSRRVEAALRAQPCEVRVYGTRRKGSDGNLTYCPPSNVRFLEDLAGCRAVISTAGNQLVGEALHYGKPMLVMPEDCPEQRINALAVERLGIGAQVSQSAISAEVVRGFLSDEPKFLDSIRRAARDGRREALDAIERCLVELVGVPSVVADAPQQVA